MAAAINFSGFATRRSICFKAMAGAGAGVTLHSLPFKRSYQCDQNKMKIQQHGMCVKRQAERKLLNGHGLYLVASSTNNSDIRLSQHSASDIIRQLYTCINEKNLNQLDNYISDDCYFEECSFPSPMEGKKEVMHFYEQLTKAMGQHVKFIIEDLCEGDEHTVGVNWHLEWMKSQIPFTRGCSFYECSTEGKKLLIKKARVVIESPIKPGGFVLTFLKNVTTLFDEFPKATDWFLKSPHVVLQFLLKIYNLFFAPFINPVIAGYLKIWTLMAGLLAFAVKILYYISKIFFW